MVMSWLIHSLDPSVRQCILWMDTTHEIWNDLQRRYYHKDAFRIYDLQEETYTLKQDDLSITAYFTHLKGLRQELHNFRPIPSCTCQILCTCKFISIIKSYREDDYVIRFLKGLSEQYSTVKSQIMLMKPLQYIDTVFSLLVQQEREMSNSFNDSRLLANFNGNPSNERGNFKGKGGKNHNYQNGGNGKWNNNGKGRNSKQCTSDDDCGSIISQKDGVEG